MFRMAMFRFRRFRVFLITAVFIVVTFLRFIHREEWENASVVLHNGEHVKLSEPDKSSPSPDPEVSTIFVDIEHLAHSRETPSALETAKDHVGGLKSSATDAPLPASATSIRVDLGPKTVPSIVLPDRKLSSTQDLDLDEIDEKADQIIMQYPGRVKPISLNPPPTPIHWEKQQEHFPMPTESIIQLPVGEAKSVPRIQHKFSEEDPVAKTKREERQRKVKNEFVQAWNGYKEYAWMHDEVRPVSGKSRDPFGGWAATLVDSLDTMWIMGLEEEFVEAVKAVATIDFTTCDRSDIPVFETTIRYLGGLLGAYDVSGHKYDILLEKAVELGEVLIGTFDTPNRMPDLYYRWKPVFDSQPHRASSRSSVAELGSLSMEFTRLAQLTKKAKYYDVVARVTDAFEEFQNRGTKLGGIFPEILNASGCNSSAPSLETEHDSDVESFNWDCVPKGLDSASGPEGRDTFSMGAMQDSTYEYFSKQYLLLGGLEDKYRTMFLKTMDAVRKYLLYRPMVPGNRDILFSGKVSTAGFPDTDLQFVPEVTHLTCFLGGMVGMGAKIFSLDSDLEIAKKLSDGCVWAYESMKNGIMAESAIVLSCDSVSDCSWNETLWHKRLDPMADKRDQLIKVYDLRKVENEAKSLAEESETAIDTSEGAKIRVSTSSFEPSYTDADAIIPVDSDEDNGKEELNLLKKRDFREDSSSAHDEMSSPQSQTLLPDSDVESRFQRKLNDVKVELLSESPGREFENPPQKRPPPTKTISSQRPPTHEEYVKSRIQSEGLPPGVLRITDNKYILRPEAIESVWYMYRITGDPTWQEKGWVMFEHIIKATRTTHGHSAIVQLSQEHPPKIDEMESFWLSETLKYFYLLYSTPDVISLDEWVLNTEAHPFKRPN